MITNIFLLVAGIVLLAVASVSLHAVFTSNRLIVMAVNFIFGGAAGVLGLALLSALLLRTL